MVPEILSSEGGERLSGITDEAVGSMGVHAQQERNEQMMGVPESLERLLADLCVRSRVDQKHAEQHDVASNTTGLGIMDFKGNFGTDLGSLDIVETRAC